MKRLFSNNILGENVAITNMQEAVACVLDQLNELKGEYFCFTNVHTTVMAHYDEKYCNVQNTAFAAFPDGKPLSLVQRMRGFEMADQVAGPDFMIEFIKSGLSKGVTHYFYGSTEETLAALEKKLRERFPEINIVGKESPPFRPLSEEEDQEVIERLNQSGADVIWVGLGAPKQENWMYAHKGKINAVMFGVGAAFDFHGGIVKRAPKWMREHYLEWLFRLCQDPKRLWKRYVTTNAAFLGLMFCDMFVWKKRDIKGNDRMLIVKQYADDVIGKIPEEIKEKYDISVIEAVPDEAGRISREYRKKQYHLDKIDGINFIRIRVPEYREGFRISVLWNRVNFLAITISASCKLTHQDVLLVEKYGSHKCYEMLGKLLKKITKAEKVLDVSQIEKLHRM